MGLATVFPKTGLRHERKAVLMLLSDCTCSLDLFIISQSIKCLCLERHYELPKVSSTAAEIVTQEKHQNRAGAKRSERQKVANFVTSLAIIRESCTALN